MKMQTFLQRFKRIIDQCGYSTFVCSVSILNHGPCLQIPKSKDQGHMKAQEIFLHYWGTPQMCTQILNKKTTQVDLNGIMHFRKLFQLAALVEEDAGHCSGAWEQQWACQQGRKSLQTCTPWGESPHFLIGPATALGLACILREPAVALGLLPCC